MPRNRRFATVEKSYITDIERERCKKVAAAYAELYELENILVLDEAAILHTGVWI